MNTDSIVLTALITGFILVVALYISYKQRELKRLERQYEAEIEEVRIQARHSLPRLRYYYYDPETKSSKSILIGQELTIKE